jgi:hypothetical protein
MKRHPLTVIISYPDLASLINLGPPGNDELLAFEQRPYYNAAGLELSPVVDGSGALIAVCGSRVFFSTKPITNAAKTTNKTIAGR